MHQAVYSCLVIKGAARYSAYLSYRAASEDSLSRLLFDELNHRLPYTYKRRRPQSRLTYRYTPRHTHNQAGNTCAFVRARTHILSSPPLNPEAALDGPQRDTARPPGGGVPGH